MGFRVIQVDTTAGTAVTMPGNTNTQVIKTYPLSASDDEWISVYALFRITTAAATAQTLNLIITVGANSFSLPYTTQATADEYAAVLFKCVSRAGDTVNVGVAGSGVLSAVTSVNVYAFYVNAESGISGGT